MDTAAIGAICAAIGAIAGVLAKWAIDKRKADRDDDKQQGDQAFSVYREMVVELRTQVYEHLIPRLDAVTEKEIECREKNATLQSQVKLLEGQIQSLKLDASAHLSPSRIALESISNAIVSMDDHGKIVAWNPAATTLFGWLQEEILGEDVTELMPKAVRSHHWGGVDSYLRTGEAKIIGIGRIVTAMRKDGSTFETHIQVSESKIPGTTGRIFTAVFTVPGSTN